MTERKPPGIGFETWIDKQIRTAQERGEFDDLPGAGKPIPDDDKPYDPMRWVASWVRREGLSNDALLPTPLLLRKEIHRLPDTVRELRSEREVRELVDDLNERIKDWMRYPSGPSVVVVPVDPDRIVDQWRADREALGRRVEGVTSAVPVQGRGKEPAQEAASQDAGAQETASQDAVGQEESGQAGPTKYRAAWWRRLVRRRGRSG